MTHIWDKDSDSTTRVVARRRRFGLVASPTALVVLGMLGQSTVFGALSMSLNTATVSLSASQSQVFTATVTGVPNTAVNWTLSPAAGTLVTRGNTTTYTAPALVAAGQTIALTAALAMDPAHTVSAAINLLPALSLTPSLATLTGSGQSVQLVAAGAIAGGVVWSLTPSVGTLVANGNTAVYTGPSPLLASQAVQVHATNVSNHNLTALAVLTLVPVTIALSPASADIPAGSQVVLTPTVTGPANTGVSWSLSPNLGTISNAGLYTAPLVLAQDTQVNVTAVAQADGRRSATAPVMIRSKGIGFSTNANGLATVMYEGTNYNYQYGEGLLSLLWEQPAAGGTVTQYTPACASTFTVNTVNQTCNANGDTFTLAVTYGTPANATLQANIVFTNNSKTNTVTQALVSTLGLSMAQFDPANSALGLNASNPLSIISFVTGRAAIWNNTPGNPNVAFNQNCGWSYICKNQPQLMNVAPGQTVAASFSLRFTNNMTESNQALAPEAYAAYAAAFPYIVNWPDRRPIALWFMSDHGHQSALNPRGYMNNPLLDVSNIPNFQTQILAQAQNIITSIKARPVQPQGIVLWDLEGQEFIQPTTYIGDPRVLGEGYDPEMNAAADQLFGLFKSAGLKVGVTLRPQYLQWGLKANLPAKCNFNAVDDFKDYYVAVDGGYHNDFYACTAPNTWSQIVGANGAQTIYQNTQVQQVINLLLAKVAYAHSRWGTTLYYVDSAVWEGGTPLPAAVFAALQQAYPDCLFMPEQSYIGTMSAAMPYAAPNGSFNALFAPETWRFAYQHGGQVTNISNCSAGACWTSDSPSFDIGQKIGDIAMYSAPFQLSATELTNIEGMIMQARAEAGTVIVTDSTTGADYTYTGAPATIYKYPVKMRVYFADSVADLAASQTYCENGGLLGTNSCTLNLAGLGMAQVRYYDFEGNLVSSATAGPR
jgi:hypothetical protein